MCAYLTWARIYGLPPDQGDKGGKGDQDGDSRRRDLEEKRDMNKGEEKKKEKYDFQDDGSTRIHAPGFNRDYNGGKQTIQRANMDASEQEDGGKLRGQFSIHFPVKLLTFRKEDADIRSEMKEDTSKGEKVDIAETFSEKEESPILDPLVSMVMPHVMGSFGGLSSKQWDGKAGWTLVAHGVKKKGHQEQKLKDPVLAKSRGGNW